MTLANDVKAKLAFQPGDAEALAEVQHELTKGFGYYAMILPIPMGTVEMETKAQAAEDALHNDYLANGITEGMATRALLTVTK